MSRIGSLLVFALLLSAPARADEVNEAEVPEEPPEGLPEALPDTAVAPVATVAPVPTPRLYIGASIGAGFALTRFGPAVSPGMEAGVILGPTGMFQPFLGLRYAGHRASGDGEDPAFADGYRWDLALNTLTVAPGLRVRLFPWQEVLSPEFSAGPVLALNEVVIGGEGRGEGGGAGFPETRQTRATGGGFLTGGLVGRLGPGQLEGHVTFSATWIDGDLTGPFLLPTVTPSIGYRVSR
jgi:hypothetical protein